MKKLILILSLAIFILIFIASCTTIDERYTGKRVKTEPAMHPDDYQSDQYYQPSYYYDPYFSPYYDPFLWTGFSFWNPFWHYGYLGYWWYGYYSPYYWGYYSPYYWGYYPSSYRSGRYYGYRSNYRTYVRKEQLSGSRANRAPSTVRRVTTGKKGYTTSIRSRSSVPKTRTSASSVSRTRTSSGTSVKRKK